LSRRIAAAEVGNKYPTSITTIVDEENLVAPQAHKVAYELKIPDIMPAVQQGALAPRLHVSDLSRRIAAAEVGNKYPASSCVHCAKPLMIL
jgi:hypothetical protein